MHSLHWAWSYIRHFKGKLCIGLLLALAVSALNMVNPYLAGRMVDDVMYGKNIEMLWTLVALMVGTTIVRTSVRYGYQIMFEKISQNVIFKMRENLYDRLLQLDFTFYDRTKTGDIMARMTGDMEAIRHFTAWTIYMIFENATIFIFAIVFMFTIHPPLAFAILSIAPVIAFFAFRLSRDVKPTFTDIRNQFAKLNSVVQENISGNRVVKAFAKESYEIEKFSVENEAFMDRNLKSAKVWERYLPVLDSLAGVLTVVMILVGGIMVINDSLTIGELVIFNSLIWALNNPLRMAGWLMNDVQRFIASAEKVEELLLTKSKMKNGMEKSTTQEISATVVFDRVYFSYGDGMVLEDVTFEAHPGQTVGIIGPTGSGKSTLVNLLSRFYDTSNGAIKVGGRNVKEWDIHQLRSSMGMVMQDIFLFSDTIEGNIAYGNPNATLEDVQAAARKAEAHDFITSLPEGYDTIVGERGVGLSGGQKQRIALARALLKDPSILILDDTTSSVDIETEEKIQHTLQTIQRSKTCFIIAHRISSVKEGDIILVMNHGKIIEKGNHEELLLKRGYYYHVFQNQYGNFDIHLSAGKVR
ncbi:ABC transporter ATP-binding protein [Bacillus coreaensis]